jgi:predicted metal-dependent hydrolase
MLARRPIRVRKLGLRFEDVPRHWLHDNAVVTHVANGLNLVFPAGERFFIRSVRHYFDRIADPSLRERCRAFFGQEASHGKEHERFFEILESQGFEIRDYLRWYEEVAFGKLEPRFPPNLRLSVTVALEHFTATLAERGLTTAFLDGAHPIMRQLLRWHASEEIEHKSVAFDVLREVDDRYWVRVAGLVLATAGLLYFWRRGTAMLLQQEGLSRGEIARQRKIGRALGQDTGFLLSGIVSYLRPGFHPDDHDNYHLARRYLESIGRLAA